MNNQGFTSGARCNYAQIPPKAPDGKYPDERKYFCEKSYQRKGLNVFSADENWRVPTDDDCWIECNEKSGKCDFCGTVGHESELY